VIATAVTALAGFVVTAITAWAVTVRLQALRARYAPHPERATFEADFNPTDANIASRVQCATTRPAEAVTSHGQ
jgi:hypothetical protein